MEKILKEKKLRNKDIFTLDNKSKEKQYTDIQIKKITGLRKQLTKDFIMEKRKQFSQNKRSPSVFIEESIKIRIEADKTNLSLGENLQQIKFLFASDDFNKLLIGIHYLNVLLEFYNDESKEFDWEEHSREKQIIQELFDKIFSLLFTIEDTIIINLMLSVFVNMTYINNADENKRMSQNRNFIELIKNLFLKVDIDILNNCILILYNIFCDSQDSMMETFFRDEFFDVLINQFINAMRRPKKSTITNFTNDKTFVLNDDTILKNFLSLSELIIKSPNSIELNKIEKILDITCEIIDTNDKTVEKECLWILFYFSKNYAEKKPYPNSDYNYDYIMQTFINKQIFGKLMAIDYSRDNLVLENILHFFKNITTDNPGIVYHLLSIQMLDYLEVILNDYKVNYNIEKLLFCILSNIADSPDSNKQEIASSTLLSKIFERFYEKKLNHKSEIKSLMVKLIERLTKNCKFAIACNLIKIKILEIMISYIEDSYMNLSLIWEILKSLKEIFFSASPLRDLSKGGNPFIRKFENLGGYYVLEKLSNHPNFTIYELVTQLIEMREQ